MIEVVIEPQAQDFLTRLKRSQPKHYRQIWAKLNELRQFAVPPRVRKVRGKGDECWRIRSGEYRIIYEDQTDGIRYIKEIGKRNDGTVYLKLNRAR